MSNIYKVAELAGVSPKTVARILAGESSRSKNRDKVLEAAKELGYVRNQQAANLRRGSSSVIGVIVPDVNNPFYGKVVQSMHDACLERGFSILLASSFGDPEGEARALRTLQSYRVDGVMLNASEHPVGRESLKVCQQLIKSGKPVVLAGEVRERLVGADRVQINNEAAVMKAVGYLISKGHRRIGFIGGLEGSYAMQQRYRGYLNALRKFGDSAVGSCSVFTNGSLSEVVAHVTNMMAPLRLGERPSAFIAGNDMIAISALKAFERLCLRVPDDVAVVGFDGIDLAEVITPSLTTMHQPQVRIAAELAELMIGRVRGEVTSVAKCLKYDADLVVRDSA
ncbi:LacI family DNA-binding transcriptional regulator [Coraliomargarita sp. SDUM461004]|uniref:LacI family DNA-binding transcriptional regulator n=1 Tax=Thalassobacterium sedimentorum TaxID=3041258 RepID=A0ABU1AN46_9BACT|nr:LacI family DNA-binding transcriptional regulator [Coraliomargarita sp. SDUM461004]MDQ8196169.1 LacI family DNA-binding transcriptional regulator [Coraliomargarita sp. SDUM461004]